MNVSHSTHITREPDDIGTILRAIRTEVQEQENKWGIQNHTNGYWLSITIEEMGEAIHAYLEGQEPENIIRELIQAAAVLVSWIDCVNRKRQ